MSFPERAAPPPHIMGSKASKPNRHEGSRSSAAGGLVEVRISHAVTWSEARLLAEQTAGGLPTCDELRAAGVTAGDGVDLWMPVRRPDGREGDYCQIGNHPMNRTRYISHIDAYGMPAWFTNKNPAGWRPGVCLYRGRRDMGRQARWLPLLPRASGQA